MARMQRTDAQVLRECARRLGVGLRHADEPGAVVGLLRVTLNAALAGAQTHPDPEQRRRYNAVAIRCRGLLSLGERDRRLE